MFTEPTNFGYRLGFTVQKDRLLGELSVEYSEASYESVETITSSYTRINIFHKDAQLVHVGFTGRIYPFNLSLTNPYVALQAGTIFAGSEIAYPLSLNIGSEFIIKLNSGNTLNPFAQYGFQRTIGSIENLNQNGSILKIGLRYVF